MLFAYVTFRSATFVRRWKHSYLINTERILIRFTAQKPRVWEVPGTDTNYSEKFFVVVLRLSKRTSVIRKTRPCPLAPTCLTQYYSLLSYSMILCTLQYSQSSSTNHNPHKDNRMCLTKCSYKYDCLSRNISTNVHRLSHEIIWLHISPNYILVFVIFCRNLLIQLIYTA
jgi:hypothetical protein